MTGVSAGTVSLIPVARKEFLRRLSVHFVWFHVYVLPIHFQIKWWKKERGRWRSLKWSFFDLFVSEFARMNGEDAKWVTSIRIYAGVVGLQEFSFLSELLKVECVTRCSSTCLHCSAERQIGKTRLIMLEKTFQEGSNEKLHSLSIPPGLTHNVNFFPQLVSSVFPSLDSIRFFSLLETKRFT